MRWSSWYAPVVFVGLVGLTTPSAALAAEWEPAKRMIPVVGGLMGAVRKVSNDTSYGYDEGVSLLAAFVAPRQTVAFRRYLTRGEKYALLGAAEAFVEDLDAEVLDADGKVVAKDAQTDATPVVLFAAPRSGEYTLRLKLYKSPRSAFCCMVLLRDGGFDVPVRNLADAASRMLALCAGVDANVKESTKFLDRPNQWAIYGGLVNASSELTITTIDLGTGWTSIQAAGDSNASDIDLFVLDEKGKVLAEDTQADATPVVTFHAQHRSSHGVRIKNVTARGPTLILLGIMKVAD